MTIDPSHDPDAILAGARDLAQRIAGEPDPVRRAALIAERDELRAAAMAAADDRRHPTSVEREIDMLEARLGEIEAMAIDKGYSEKHLGRTIQDPGAYRHAINRLLEDHHRTEVEAIERRLARLRTLIDSDSA